MSTTPPKPAPSAPAPKPPAVPTSKMIFADDVSVDERRRIEAAYVMATALAGRLDLDGDLADLIVAGIPKITAAFKG